MGPSCYVMHVRLVLSPPPPQLQGFGFINFEEPEQAASAVQALNGGWRLRGGHHIVPFREGVSQNLDVLKHLPCMQGRT